MSNITNGIIKDFDDVEFKFDAEIFEKDDKKSIFIKKTECESQFGIEDLFMQIRSFIINNMHLKSKDYIYIEHIADNLYIVTEHGTSKVCTDKTIKQYKD